MSLLREKLSFLKITHIPKVEWSSNTPFNVQPRLITIFYLILGLTLFGLGEALLIISSLGVTPWTVLAEGIANKSNVSVGLATFFVSISILILWVPLKQKMGIGTISNAIIIASTIDFFVYLIPLTDNYFLSTIYLIVGILLVGLGSGIYLTTNLGPGTRDGLMKGISENFKKVCSVGPLSGGSLLDLPDIRGAACPASLWCAAGGPLAAADVRRGGDFLPSSAPTPEANARDVRRRPSAAAVDAATPRSEGGVSDCPSFESFC